MTNSITPFNFDTNQIRVTIDDHGPWFAATDVCTALGYLNPRQAIKKNCRDKGVSTRDTLTNGGHQKLIFIDEGNLYRLVIKSRKSEARKFEDWVCDEVLPTIRKTGKYETPKPEALTPAQQRHLQNRVNEIVRKTPATTHAAIWSSVKNRFSVGSYKDIPAEMYPEVCEFLDCSPEDTKSGTVLSPPVKRFNIPASEYMCDDEGFIHEGAGTFCFGPKEVLNRRYRSPVRKLLNQLRAEGHSVDGAELEIDALYYILDVTLRITDQITKDFRAVAYNVTVR